MDSLNVDERERRREIGATLPTEDDELSDISTMGGVNFMEEGQKVPVPNEIEAYIRKYKNENFLINQALELKVNTKIRQHGLNELESDVVGIISHATQEYLRNLIEKLAVIAEHRLENIKLDPRFEAAQDVKSQLKFLDELEKLEKKRHEEHEREVLLRAAKLHLLENIIPCLSLNIFVQSRSKLEDPEQVKLKQKAKDMQKAEQEELRHREANATALLAIGPRKKLRIDSAAVATGAQNTQVQGKKVRFKFSNGIWAGSSKPADDFSCAFLNPVYSGLIAFTCIDPGWGSIFQNRSYEA
ncbi:Taf4, partial [Cordylochernes scorpioides]